MAAIKATAMMRRLFGERPLTRNDSNRPETNPMAMNIRLYSIGSNMLIAFTDPPDMPSTTAETIEKQRRQTTSSSATT